MAYQVLARKWRPKNFSELIGQDSIRQILSNALKQKRLYPVLIFTGPRGTGKTSTARITAKSLRCQNKKGIEPCNKCEDCVLIGESRHLDVIEIDGASNNGVDAIRELRDTVAYMPSSGYWKIYIIDEVHMLSQSAFNALLKTLEEPPEHVIFIMATTESHKIPLTVLSRSQKLDFHLLSTTSIKNQLEKISKEESFSVSDSILWLLAKQARGSLRDAQSLLDQVIAFCGGREEEAIKILALSDPQLLKETLSALLKKKEEDIIYLIARLRTKGIESKLFLEKLIESVSYLLFLKQNPKNDPPLVQAGAEEIEFMKKEIEFISYEDLHFLFDMLLKGEREMSLCQDSDMFLEILLLRLCSAPRIEEITPLSSIKKESSPSNKKSLASPTKKPAFVKTETLDEKPSEKKTRKNFEQGFKFIEYLRKKDRSLAGLIENLSLKKESLNFFCFHVPDNFSYLKKKLEDKSLQKQLKKELSCFLETKEDLKINFIFKKEPFLSLREEKKTLEKKKLLSQARANSFVNEITNVFNGKIKSVKKIDKEQKGP